MLKKSVILELKRKSLKKKTDQWNDTKQKLKIMNVILCNNSELEITKEVSSDNFL